ncbi:hypothetical protein BB561_002062 [Smittium simulii]|uniref:RNA helicase n=1 Tax=Smittium simulii TaxID=133385 RepID=A0A2T9YRY0_9FUNG|nr:hypothetical protein BB561_002062 [Smittium simulii]
MWTVTKKPHLSAQNSTPGAQTKPLNSGQSEDTSTSDILQTETKSSLDEPQKQLQWKKVEIPKHFSAPDNEMGGLLEFEEIDGEYFDQNSLDLSKLDQAENSHPKKAQNFDDLDDINWDDFIFVDDFDQDTADKTPIKTIGQLARESIDNSQNVTFDSLETVQKSVEPETQHNPSLNIKQKNKKSKPAPKNLPASKADDKDKVVLDTFNESLWAWKNLGLCDALLKGIQSCGFKKPTEIQKKSLPPANKGRDILGAAETGSGKTLAFGLPMLQYVIQNRAENISDRCLMALVLLPTRELALQVKENLSKVDRESPVRIVSLVGGMSLQKQERLLTQNPEIIVATTGRLWEIIEQTDLLTGKLEKIKFLVLDEADRMVERGHFKELTEILRIVNSDNEAKRQTMVFSATLNKNLSFQKKKLSSTGPGNSENPMQEMINVLKFKDPNPLMIDVTPANAISKKIFETRIDCLKSEKEVYLYFFLTRFIGKSLVFVNSISSIRRLIPILTNLNVEVFPLHAQMQQRQRLKNLDRFKESKHGVLIASDVAARGLDIPSVDHVIHYQVPRGGELYVHRSGRTARAHLEGVVVIIVCPEERKNYLKLCKTLRKDEIPILPMEYSMVAKFKPLVTLSREIDSIEHRLDKESHDQEWMSKAADEMGIEIDPDL